MVSGSSLVAAFERAAKLREARKRFTTIRIDESRVLAQSISSKPPLPMEQGDTERDQIQWAEKRFSRKHKPHDLLPFETRRVIVYWMNAQFSNNGERLLILKTV